MAPQSKRDKKTQKNKPPNVTKAGSSTPKKFLVCCSIAIKVPRRFVEL